MGSSLSQANPLSIAEHLIDAPVSIYNNERNISAQNRANQMNLQENERNRQFNANEAQKQRDFEAQQAEIANKFASNEALEAFKRSSAFTKEMWQKQNEYDSPNSQIARLKDAGLNPNIFGGANTSSSVGAVSSPSASPSMPHGSSASANSSIPVAPVSYINPLLETAQIRLANAQANKAEEDANLNKTQSERIKALLNGELKIQNSTYKVQMSEAMRNEADSKKSLKEIEKIDSEKQLCFAKIDEIRQNISNLQKQGLLTQKELDSYEDRLAVELQESLSRTKMNGAALISYLASANASNAQASLSHEQQRLVCKQIVHQSIANDIIAIDYRIKDKTEVSTVKLINSQNNLETNDISVQNTDDWRYPRLFLSTLGQVFSANASVGVRNVNK